MRDHVDITFIYSEDLWNFLGYQWGLVLNQPVYDYKTEICEYVHGIHCSKLRSYLGVAAENWMYCNPQFALVIEKTCGNDYKPWDLGVPCDQGRICHRTTVSSIPKKPLGLP